MTAAIKYPPAKQILTGGRTGVYFQNVSIPRKSGTPSGLRNLITRAYAIAKGVIAGIPKSKNIFHINIPSFEKLSAD